MNGPAHRKAEVAREMALMHAFLAGYGAGNVSLERWPEGGHNRLFRVRREGGCDWLLKCYLPHSAGRRDGFAVERAFYTLLWEHGVRQIPEPLGWDDRHRFGLFRFPEGRKLSPGEAGLSHVLQALAFVTVLNRLRPFAAGRGLPAATEACFSMASHLALVARRIQRLLRMETRTFSRRQAVRFVSEELEPSFQIIQAAVLARCRQQGLDPNARLKLTEVCLSPSAFGLFNAILGGDGQLCFFDFEDGGWDDPARLICDFFPPTDLRAPRPHWEVLASGVARALGHGPELIQRACLLWPVLRLKWCCLLLGELLPEGNRRTVWCIPPAEGKKWRPLSGARQIIRQLAEEGGQPPP